jgi:hypothetical protein
MEIKTREINGVRCQKEKRYIEITFDHDGTSIDCGFLNYQERVELASHLSDVVEDLLYNLEKVE